MISEAPDDTSRILKVLDRLRAIIKLHFTMEENTMSECSYPHSAEHKLSHAFIIGELSAVADLIHEMHHREMRAIVPHLRTRLRNHMQHFDRGLADYLAFASISGDDEAMTFPSYGTEPQSAHRVSGGH